MKKLVCLKKGNLTLYRGDAENPNSFTKPFADLIITSPPYNVGIEYGSSDDSLPYDQYLKFCRTWISNCYRWAKPEARFVLNVPFDTKENGIQSISADLTVLSKECGWRFHDGITWSKNNVSSRTAWGSWRSASAPNTVSPVEHILVFYKEDWTKTQGSHLSDMTADEFVTYSSGLWTFTGESSKRSEHPAAFPRELPRRVIKMFSYVGDTIFDPFSGSGTVLVEAQVNNRIGVGLELDLGYCELARNRIIRECWPGQECKAA